MLKLCDKIEDVRPWDLRNMGASQKKPESEEGCVGSENTAGQRETPGAGETKKLRDARGHTDLNMPSKTMIGVSQRRLPPRTARNLKHYPFLRGGRNLLRLGKHAWEERVARNLMIVEENRYGRANAIYHALGRIAGLLNDAEARETVLKVTSKELLETTDYLQTLMDSMADILLVTGPDGVIQQANQAAERISGYPPAELSGMSFEQLFTEPLTARKGIEQVLSRRWLSNYELILVLKEGNTTPVMCNATVLEDAAGRVTGVLINARDMTELKRAQEARERYALEVTRANEDLEHFASVASHDLQAPLKKVSRHTERLAEVFGDRLDGETRKDLDVVMDQTLHMQGLIKAVLDYARVNTGVEIEETADYDAVLDQALSNLEAVLEDSPVEVIRDTLPTLRGDAEQLARLFQNLVGNALKYYDPQKEKPLVRVTARRIDEADVPLPEGVGSSGWLFCVRDNGFGIDEDFQDDVFNMFVRLHTRDEYPGEGMGLAISKRVVRRHGGEIWLTSEYGVGSRFYFTIPD